MTIYFTPDGRYSTNGIFANDGTLVKPGTMFLVDGTRLFELHDHTIPIYAFTSTLQSKAITGTYISYDIVLSCTNNTDPGYQLIASVPIPAGFTLINAVSNEGTYNETTGKWTLLLDINQDATLNLILEPTATGTKTQTVSLDGGTATLTSTCVIGASDSEGAIASHNIDLTDYPNTLANMQDGKQYTIITYSRVHETGVTGIHDGVKNNRISVTNNITSYGTRATLQDTIQKITATFIYDSDHDVIITWYDEYQGVSTVTEDREYGLCINEGFNTVYSESTNLLTSPIALLDDTSSSDLTLPGASESAEYVFSFSPSTILSTQFFTGMLLNINSFGMVASGIQAQIKTDETESDVKSTFISSTGQISLGEMADMWGMNEEDLQGETINAHVKIKNTTLNEQSFSYSNVELILYYADDETGGQNSIIAKGIHGRVYGISLSDDNNPGGASYDLETLKIAMMDGELPIRFNIQSKELEIDFPIHGDTIEESQTKLKAISNWLTNEKTTMGKPIPYSLIFTYDLTSEYFVIFNDVIEVDKEVTSLICTAKFTVPDGVARSTEPVISGPIGTNPGKDRVWPLIEVKTDGSETLTVTDNVTSNTITLNSPPASNTTLLIDCAARTVTGSDGTDYNSIRAINIVWINFAGKADFDITVTGGVLQQLSFYPGF